MIIKNITVGLCSLLILFSCNDNKERPVEPKVNDYERQIEINTTNENSEWEDFKNKAEIQIEENYREISDLEVKKSDKKGELRKKHDDAISDLKERNNRLRVRIKEFRKEGEEKWQEFKREFNHDMDEFQKALRDLNTDNKK